MSPGLVSGPSWNARASARTLSDLDGRLDVATDRSNDLGAHRIIQKHRAQIARCCTKMAFASHADVCHTRPLFPVALYLAVIPSWSLALPIHCFHRPTSIASRLTARSAIRTTPTTLLLICNINSKWGKDFVHERSSIKDANCTHIITPTT